MSLNLKEKNKTMVKTPNKRNREEQAKGTFLFLFIIGLVGFLFGYRAWNKVLDKHVKY